jgi:hypothetical protein
MPLSQQGDTFSHRSPILFSATAYPLTFALTYTFFAAEEEEESSIGSKLVCFLTVVAPTTLSLLP